MTKPKGTTGSLLNKLLIFLNEHIIGDRQAARIITDLQTMQKTPGNIMRKLKALKLKKPRKTIKAAIIDLLRTARLHTRTCCRKTPTG